MINKKKFIETANAYLDNKENTPTIESLCAFCGVSKQWFYSQNTNELDAIRTKIQLNKQKIISVLDKKLMEIVESSTNDASRISAIDRLYKIYGTKEQRKKLNGIIENDEKETEKKITVESVLDMLEEADRKFKEKTLMDK